jgi:cytochrome bd-type quinol oxidase subunit 1
VSAAVSATDIVLSIALFGAVYAALFVLWLWMLIDEIRHGPEPAPAHPPVPSTAPLGTPGRPGPLALGGR